MDSNALLKRLLPLGLLFLLLVILQPIFLVGPGERGVVTHFGAVDPRPLNEGLHLVIPIRDRSTGSGYGSSTLRRSNSPTVTKRKSSGSFGSGRSVRRTTVRRRR